MMQTQPRTVARVPVLPHTADLSKRTRAFVMRITEISPIQLLFELHLKYNVQ
jgi:hypothetical protein